MKKSRFAMAGAALVAFGLLGPAGAANKNTGSQSIPCGENGTLAWAPTRLWPPNHKAQNITFTYTDSDSGTKTLAIVANPHNEIVDNEEVNGTGNTPAATDAVGGASGPSSESSITVVGSAVSERSGHKNADGGRVYRFDYDADNVEDDGSNDGCSSDPANPEDGLVVFVPHDCRNGACRPQS